MKDTKFFLIAGLIVAVILSLATACGTETVEIPVEKIVTQEVVKTVEIEKPVTVVKEVVKTVEVPGETVIVEKEVTESRHGRSARRDHGRRDRSHRSRSW